MSLDLILCAPTVSAMRIFLVNRNLITLEAAEISGQNIVPREGFEFTPWAGSWQNTPTGVQISGGDMITRNKQLRSSLAVDVVQGGQFAFNIGATTPPWLDNTVTAESGLEVIGTYDRKQGNFAVFTPTGTLPTVGDTLDVYTPQQTLNQFVILCRIFGNFREQDRIDETTEGEEPEQWHRSAVVKAIRNNGAPITVAGDINGYEWDNVKLFRAQDVQAFLSNRGVPGHEWLGGNNY